MPQNKPNAPQEGEANLVSRIGPVEVDWPRAIGFYGGLAIAVATEMIAPPLAIFIGAYPLFKLLNRPNAPLGVQVVTQVFEGAAKPINGDAEGTIRIATDSVPMPKPRARAPRRQSGTANPAARASRKTA